MKRFKIYWFNEDDQFKKADLFNVRDDDIVVGGRINRGDIVRGKCGYHIAESNVLEFSALSVAKFCANRKCKWFGFEFYCMTLNGLPIGPVSRGQAGGLRHKHCVVAELVTDTALHEATNKGLPVVKTLDGRHLANLEVASIPQRQPLYRRAQLL